MVLVGPTDENRPPKPSHLWDSNIEMDFRKRGWVAWTVLIGLRVGTCDGLLSIKK
jgi:hypothetical protein